MEEFSCARCPDGLAEADVSGVALAECPSCGGLFFESPDLAKILTEGRMSAAPGTGREDADVACPRCRTPMLQLRPTVAGGFAFHLCEVCHGSWLDALELGRLRRARVSQPTEVGQTSDGRRARATLVLEQMEDSLGMVERQRVNHLERLEKLMSIGFPDPREVASIRAIIDAEVAIAHQAMARSPLFEDTRRLCIEGYITGARFESIRERLGA